MRWTRFLGFALVCTIVCARAALAMQPGTLIAELVEYGDVRAVVPATTAETFRRAINPTPEQMSAVTLLVDGARTQVARIINRHQRTVRDDPTLEQMRESEAKVVKDAGVVERQLLADLLAILTPEQQTLFPKFERAHRRALLLRAAPQPMPLDLWTFFATNRFDPEAKEELRDLLGKFDRDSDAALVRQRRALLAYYANVRLGYDGSDEARQRERNALNELLSANQNQERVAAAIVEPLIGSLPAELADKLVFQIITRAIGAFDKNLSDPDRYPVVREVLKIELTPEQRSSLQSILSAAKSEALERARSTAIEQARYVLLDDKTRTDGRTSPLNLFLGAASAQRVRVSNEALSLLTPQQRLDYDASAVIDPSTTSTVEDE
ncbi:MAG: hypothetical protein ACOYN0_19035 [Phycisphaerales bacterium]